MTRGFDRGIARAEQLVERFSESADLLRFYVQIARFQKSIVFEKTDVRTLTPFITALIELVERSGPESLARNARARISEEILVKVWNGEEPDNEETRFLARALLQPFAEYLASRGTPSLDGTGAVCPFCSSKPVVGVLRGEGDGGKRSLICSLCATEWQYRRIVCPSCGEEDKEKLPVFTASGIDHVRVEACDTCGTYIKSVDLTRDGFAVPIVDELATVVLNLWASDHGYTKVETNLLGM